MRDPLLPVDPLTGRPLPELREVDRGPDMPVPSVLCPFADDMTCPANPPCPTPLDRACIGDDE